MSTIKNQVLLKEFEVHLSDSALAPATIVNYVADLRAFLRWSEETIGPEASLFDLEPTDVQDFCSYLRETKGQAPATVNRRLQALRKFYSFSVTRGWTGANPAERVPLLSETVSGRSRFLTSDDVSRLLTAVKHGSPRWRDRDWAIIQVFLGSGLKLSELTALRLSDVELGASDPCLHARDAAGEPGRIVPLAVEPHDALVAYLPARKAAPGVEHFFVNRDGNPLSTRSIQRLLSQYGQEADLPGLTTQALRYQYARKICESHDDVKAVSNLLGHRHVATTIRYLRPTSPEEERPPFPMKQDGDRTDNPDEI